MTVTEAVVKKLKIKISTKGIRTAHENGVKVIGNDAQCQNNYVNENKKPETSIKFKLPVPANSNKRGPQVTLDGQKEKRRKMDRSIKQQCGSILQVLMTHKDGWPFLNPVDPVVLGIPDYFQIITKPMDLGTVKSKLEGNLYFSAEEFAADVRLTFANCMKYNPPFNPFHIVARELDSLFNRRWSLMESKWKRKSGSDEKGAMPNLLELKADFDDLAAKTESAERAQHVLSGKTNHKVSLVDSQYDSCGISLLKCGQQSTCSAVSSKDMSSKRLLEEGQWTSSKLDREIKSSSTVSWLVPDTNGAGLQKEKESPSSDHSSCATTSTTDCTPLAEAQLSPTKALRAAILKSRFAETILKANHKGEKTDPLKLQQERERLQKQQLAEKARLEEQIKVAEAASRMRAEAELKVQREQEREAARIALEKMEKTVVFEDNLKIIRDLERLSQCRLAINFSLARNPLERLGLYIKEEDFLEEEEDGAVLNGQGEEGEILT